MMTDFRLVNSLPPGFLSIDERHSTRARAQKKNRLVTQPVESKITKAQGVIFATIASDPPAAKLGCAAALVGKSVDVVLPAT